MTIPSLASPWLLLPLPIGITVLALRGRVRFLSWWQRARGGLWSPVQLILHAVARKPADQASGVSPPASSKVTNLAHQTLNWKPGIWLEGLMWLLATTAWMAAIYSSYNSLMAIFTEIGGFELWESRVSPFLVDAPLGSTAIAIYLIARWGRLDKWIWIQLGPMAILSALATVSGNALAGALSKGLLILPGDWTPNTHPAAAVATLSGGWSLFATLTVSAFPALCILEVIVATKCVLTVKAKMALEAALDEGRGAGTAPPPIEGEGMAAIVPVPDPHDSTGHTTPIPPPQAKSTLAPREDVVAVLRNVGSELAGMTVNQAAQRVLDARLPNLGSIRGAEGHVSRARVHHPELWEMEPAGTGVNGHGGVD